MKEFQPPPFLRGIEKSMIRKMGARAVNSNKGREWNLSLYAPVIVKYCDEKNDAATQPENLVR